MSYTLRNQSLAFGIEAGLGNDDFLTEQSTEPLEPVTEINIGEGAGASDHSRFGRTTNGLDLEFGSMNADAIAIELNVQSEDAAAGNSAAPTVSRSSTAALADLLWNAPGKVGRAPCCFIIGRVAGRYAAHRLAGLVMAAGAGDIRLALRLVPELLALQHPQHAGICHVVSL